MAEHVVVNDVGPRDGLQNQEKILSAQERLQLINALLAAGVNAIEAGSFVSPKAVPAMAGTDEIFAGLPKGGYAFSALIPNRRGYELAKDSGAKTVGLVLAASDTMNKKNINRGTDDALAGFADILADSKNDGINALAYVATAWECPFEGAIDASVVIELSGKLLDAGATEIVLADTIGAADPGAVARLLKPMVAEFGAENISCHFHDTRGMGVADVYAAVEQGIRKFDASIGGLGGCPFAPGATGNVATEDVVLLLHQMGFETGISLAKLIDAADLAKSLTGNCDGGHSTRWIKRQIEKGTLN